MPQKLNPDLTGLNDPLNSIGVTYLLRFWLSKSYKRFRQPTFVFWYLLQVVYGLGGQLKKFILKRSHWQTPLVIPVPINHHFDRPSLLPKCKNNSWMPSYWIFCTLAISYAAWKCPYSQLFWSAFSHIRTEYGEILRVPTYSVRIPENTDQNNSEYGHFLRSLVMQLLSQGTERNKGNISHILQLISGAFRRK